MNNYDARSFVFSIVSITSLLAYIAPRLTNQLENLATDSLFYLLRRYDSLGKGFLEIIREMGLDLDTNLTFDTQRIMDGGEIPDLVGINDRGETVLLVESKFWAPLTPNQPVSYLSYLSSNSDGLVVILGPATRYETLWPKIVGLCEEAKLYPSEELGSPPHQISVRLTPKSRLGYLSWGYLLKDFQSILNNEGNLRGSNEVWQLLALTKRLEAEAFQPFVPEELISGSDTRINQLKSIINAVVEKLNEAGHLDYKGYRATPGAGYYKRYFTFLDNVNWYIEYNEHRSQRFGISLILLGGPKTKGLAISSLSSEITHKPKIVEDGNDILFPLHVPLGVEESDVMQSLIDQVVSIAEIIRKI